MCPKNSWKIILIISVKEPSGITKGGKGGHHKRPGESLARPHPRPRQEASWLPGGSPRHPPSPIFTPRGETPKKDSFSRSRLCTAAAAASRSGLPGEAAPAPCREKLPPPGDHP